MKIRVQDAADIDGLVAFFEERDCVTEQIGPNTIEVSRLSSIRRNGSSNSPSRYFISRMRRTESSAWVPTRLLAGVTVPTVPPVPLPHVVAPASVLPPLSQSWLTTT